MRSFFTHDAWLVIQGLLESKRKQSFWTCKSCQHELQSIASEACLEWYHWDCVGVSKQPKAKNGFVGTVTNNNFIVLILIFILMHPLKLLAKVFHWLADKKLKEENWQWLSLKNRQLTVCRLTKTTRKTTAANQLDTPYF